MLRLLKALPLALALTSLCFFAVSCGSTSQSQVRVVHAISDAPALDVDVNTTKVFTNITFAGTQDHLRRHPVEQDALRGDQIDLEEGIVGHEPNLRSAVRQVVGLGQHRLGATDVEERLLRHLVEVTVDQGLE